MDSGSRPAASAWPLMVAWASLNRSTGVSVGKKPIAEASGPAQHTFGEAIHTVGANPDGDGLLDGSGAHREVLEAVELAVVVHVLPRQEATGDVNILVGDPSALVKVDLGYFEVTGHGADAYAQGEATIGQDVYGGGVLEHLEWGAEWGEGHGGPESHVLRFPSSGREKDEGVQVGEGDVVRDPEVVVAEVIGHPGELKGLGAFFGREKEGAELQFVH